ncbi:thioredoxin-related transmembrane protein 1 [Drosophila elegans]|uniref:thioredoxin-related transmembrane protein 1 n=1 Tax=Drosophila elegans TaxID=30023 RepID=UPI0007E5DF98|nr:thioredoxin-related transmembrane protein 1 [Drosophila elegans]
MKFLIVMLVLVSHGEGCMLSKKTGRGIGDDIVTKIDDDNWMLLLKDEWLFLLCPGTQTDCQDLNLNLYRLATGLETCLCVGVAFADLSMPSALRRRFSAFDGETLYLYHVIDGHFRPLSSAQDHVSLQNLLSDEEWKKIRPVPFWKHPTSTRIGLSVLAYRLTSGYSGTCYRVATYIISFLIAGILTYGGYAIYILWYTISCRDNSNKKPAHEKIKWMKVDGYQELDENTTVKVHILS